MNWLLVWGFLSLCVGLTWIVAVRQKRGGIVDTVWAYSLGFTSIIWFFLESNPEFHIRSYITILVAGFWAHRLGSYLFRRIKREGEDARYGKLIQHWGTQWKLKLFVFYQIQALASTVLSISFFLAVSNPVSQLQFTDFIAIAIAIIAILGEALSDKQLDRFRSNSEGKNKGVCKTGLWKYTRHPNYFFEWLFWISLIFLSIGHSFFYLSLIPALAIYYFLNKGSGIPYAEKQSIARRGNAYIQYQKETNAFFPWFPKKNSTLN